MNVTAATKVPQAVFRGFRIGASRNQRSIGQIIFKMKFVLHVKVPR